MGKLAQATMLRMQSLEAIEDANLHEGLSHSGLAILEAVMVDHDDDRVLEFAHAALDEKDDAPKELVEIPQEKLSGAMPQLALPLASDDVQNQVDASLVEGQETIKNPGAQITKSASSPVVNRLLQTHTPGSKLALQRLQEERARRMKKKQELPFKKWDRRHHLAPQENELKPKALRAYFSVPESLEKLTNDVSKNRYRNSVALLPRLQKPEAKKGDVGHPLTHSSISADTDMGHSPHRHKLAGSMIDLDGEVRGWNNRFVWGPSVDNHLLHPLHRETFCKPSLFATAPSQLWRRQMHYEVKPGMWRSTTMTTSHTFPPLGC